MRTRVKYCALTGIVLLALGGLFCWGCWPVIIGYVDWHNAKNCIDDHPAARFDKSDGFAEIRYDVNTFTNGLESSDIKEFYEDALSHMLKQYGAACRTYQWRDQDGEGWSQMCTIYQGSEGYIAVRVGCSNDSDGASMVICRGLFDKTGKTLLKTPHIPAGMLRCDWESTAR